MRTPRNWRQLQRHPLSAEYQDLTGRAWDEFLAGVKAPGILNQRKITLHEGKVLDGWQLQRACVVLGIKPRYQPLPERVTPEAFVTSMNDHRRHETQERAMQRTEQRRTRVAAAKRDGQSLRAIAEEEGVSKSQVERDLGQASGVPGGTPGPQNGTTIGKDGKTYPANKPSISKRESTIPERLKPFFASVPLFQRAARSAERLANIFQEIEQTPAYQKTVEGKRHAQFSTYIRTAGRAIEAMTPRGPCPECGGAYEPSPDADPCKACADKGYQTAEEVGE